MYSRMQRLYNYMSIAIGISRTSENKLNSLRLLNAIYEDEEIYNLLMHGIEGKHYTVDENGFSELPDSQYSAPAVGISNGDFKFPVKYIYPYAKDLKEELTNKTVDDILVNCAITYDDDYMAMNVKIGEITSTMSAPRMYGTVPNVKESIKKEKAALKEAGIDKFVAEIQKQVDAYVEGHPEAIKNFKESRKAVNAYNKANPNKTNPKDYK